MSFLASCNYKIFGKATFTDRRITGAATPNACAENYRSRARRRSQPVSTSRHQ